MGFLLLSECWRLSIFSDFGDRSTTSEDPITTLVANVSEDAAVSVKRGCGCQGSQEKNYSVRYRTKSPSASNTSETENYANSTSEEGSQEVRL